MLPPDLRAELAKLAVGDFTVITSADAFIYSGTIRSLGEALFSSSLNWPIELPLLNVGVPFQLVRARLPVAAGTDLEPAPDGFQLDLLLQRVAIVVPGLQPATAIAGAGVTPAHLLRPVPGDRLYGKSVKIVGSGTLRIASAPGGGAPLIRFVAPPDPLDPAAPTGALLGLGFEPPSFFFGGSDYGLTVDTLVYDDSDVFTPAEIEARGQGPDWRGISIKQATLYFPRDAPAVGDLSVGVRDVLLGSPLGLQGEVRIELGTTPVNPATLTFTQHQVGTPPADAPLGAASPGAAARTFQVSLATGSGSRATVSGRGASGSNHRWTFPDGSHVDGEASGPFGVEAGDRLAVAGLEGSGADVAESPPITVQFAAASPVVVPTVNAVVGPTTHVAVTSLSGSAAALRGVTFALDPATDTAYRWQLGEGVAAQTGNGATFAPTFPATPGTCFLKVGKTDGAPQRVEVEVLTDGALMVGGRAGVFDGAGSVPVRDVEGSYDLIAFDSRGDFKPSADGASVAAGVVSVPGGSIARVTVERSGDGTSPTPPAAAPVPRHVQVWMDYDSATPTQYVADGDLDGASPVAFDPQMLTRWRDRFSGASFLVVGRTCDIGSPAFNERLSATRAAAGKALLGSGVTVFQRGERFQWTEPGADAGGAAVEAASSMPSDMRAAEVITAGTSTATTPHHDGWLFKIRNSGGFPTDTSTTSHDRPRFRRVDIHAVGGTEVPDPQAPPSPATQAATGLRRALVPGALPLALTPPSPRDVATPYRVRLVVRWDSPSVVQLSDAIPTQAEVTVAWQGKALPVPGGSGSVTPTATTPVTSGGHEIFTFIGGWTYDPRTTATQFSLALNSTGDPDGLATLTGDSAAMNAVSTALAIGPALLAGLQSGDVAGGAARVSALVAAIGFAAAYGRDGKVTFHGIKVEWRQRAIDSVSGARFRLLCDYTAAIGFDFDQFGIRITANKPIKVRYRDVGIEIDGAKSGFDAFGVVYENASFDIEDPGQWTITGPLGDLIRVAASRAGSGSTWVELDLTFAIDLGVVKITGCTLRASFSNGGLAIEFRGFSASIDLPGVVKGSGGVSIGDGGLIRAGLAATIVPINTSAVASLALQGDFVALEVGVILPVGIPLLQSGLAIYGFIGRVVSNGKRNMVGLSADPVERELEWYGRPGEQKYSPAKGQWAMGLGVSIGTMPDTGFTFNALGMVSVGFPDPDVVVSIDASLFQKPALPAADNNAPASSLKILGIIAISPAAVVVGVRGTYVIPKILKLELPFGAYFPISPNPDPAFVRIGADGVNGRTGDPVRLRLLPDTLDIGVWAFTMVEERSLLRLGDIAGFDLNGFSIGFGAGWSMKWGGGPIYLRASAKIVAGLGTKPLTIVAGLFIEGELRLIIVSVSVRGDVKALLTEKDQLFSGEFCGKVDFFFFSVEGCVHVEFGSGSDPGIPDPDHPLTRIDLTNRTGAIVGRAYQPGETQDPDRPAVAWPDTVPLLNFAAYIQNRLTGSAFAPNPAELPGEPWSGSTELKYGYRLKSLAIRKRGGSPMAGPIESVWWWPTHRGGVLVPGDPPPSEHEGRQLALLSWYPTPWSRNLADGGAGTPADPGHTVGQICIPVKETSRGCVRGDMQSRERFDSVRLSGAPGTRFAATVSEFLPGASSLADVSASVSLAGWHLVAGSAVAFAPPVDVPAGPKAVKGAYQLASLAQGPSFIASLGARIVPTRAIADAVLTLELCAAPPREVTGRRCDDFADLPVGTRVANGELRRPTVTYRWLSTIWKDVSPVVDHFAPRPDGRAELWVGSKGVLAVLDVPTNRVDLVVAFAVGEPVVAVAMNAAGAVIARAVAPPQPLTALPLVLQAEGITTVHVYGGTAVQAGVSPKSGGSLLRLCTGQGADGDAAGMLTSLLGKTEPGKPPQVEALLSDGSRVRLDGKVVGAIGAGPGPMTHVSVSTGRRCALVQYAAPRGKSVKELVVPPWTGGRTAVVALCGTDWVSRYVVQTNGAAQAGTAGTFTNHADPSTSERPNLLDADTDYEIVVGVQWTGWRKNRGDPAGAQPPPLDDSLTWHDFPDTVFSFRTAPAAVLPANPPPFDFRQELTFDPRGLVRYLLGFRPDGSGAPHFLADGIQVDFRADHVAPLLARYGRTLALKLRRTDPPAASLAAPGGLGHSRKPADIALKVKTTLLDKSRLEPADRLLVDAAAEAPCTEAPAVGGRTLDISAPLDPDADYDLLLVAPPATTPDLDSVLVARAHFHTSRYSGPATFLEAMSLSTSGSADPRLPMDAFVDPSALTPVPDPNDAAFESVLRGLGLDPWPLPTLPRVVAIWSKAVPFRFLGIMLETDEPLDRGSRMQVTAVTVAGVSLQRIVSNTATTRMLWMASAPLTLAGDTEIDVTVKDDGVDIHGRRTLFRVPRLALLEGVT